MQTRGQLVAYDRKENEKERIIIFSLKDKNSVLLKWIFREFFIPKVLRSSLDFDRKCQKCIE